MRKQTSLLIYNTPHLLSVAPSSSGPLSEAWNLRVLYGILAVPMIFAPLDWDLRCSLNWSQSPSLVLQPLVLLSPQFPLSPLLPTSFPAPLSIDYISWASSVPSSRCLHHLRLRYLTLSFSSPYLNTDILSVWIWKSHRISVRPFSITLGSVVHFEPPSFGAIILLYSWFLVVSPWIVALTITILCLPLSAGLLVKPSMNGEELPCLDICDFYLILWPGYYISKVSVDGQGIGVDG